MNNRLLEIEPKELKFSFELKKQSSCSVQLTNNTHYHIAFKVKTTAPKKYSVRPNVGVLMPKSTCEFIVTMQAQRVAPGDMVCKDKFLIQSTIVPVGTTDEDVTSSLFVRDNDRYVEENKLKVTLISPPSSPELSSIDGDFKNGLSYEKDQIFNREEIVSPEPMIIQNAEHSTVSGELNHEKYIVLNSEQDVGLKTMKDVDFKNGLSYEKDQIFNREEIVSPEPMIIQNAEHSTVSGELNHEKYIVLNSEQDVGLKTMKDVDFKNGLSYEKDQIFNREEIVSPEPMIIQNAEHSTVSGELNHEKYIVLNSEQDVGLKTMKDVDFKNGLSYEKDQIFNREEIVSPEPMIIQNEEHSTVSGELNHEKYIVLNSEQDVGLKTMKDVEELKPETAELKVSNDVELNTLKDVEELKTEKEAELNVSKGVEELKLMETIEKMKFKLDELESKLNEAGVTISKLTDERRLSNLATKMLQDKLADLSKRGARKVQVGFPLLYVCMVALICVFLGYCSRS